MTPETFDEASAETFDQSDVGYPEEQPAGAVPDDGSEGESAVREHARPDTSGAPDNDDGKSTGNPHSAG